MKSMFVLAGVSLLGIAAAQAASPLDGLVSNRGAATVAYERAVGKRAEFERLAGDGPAAGVSVSVVADTPDHAGQRVAAAYVEGLRKVLPSATLASAWGDAPPPPFVAEVGVSTVAGTEGTAEKTIMAAQGSTCMLVDKKLQCTEAANAPNPLGKKDGSGTRPAIAVKIRFYRHDRTDSAAAPVTVFEDAFSVSYVPTECPDPALAAVTVARLLGESALTSRAVNISFPTTPRQLSCNAKA
ncbi:hypothetical protein [Pseudoxanthomonas sp. 10H]|uniref:hypothetical protein n=1 Tax=Pseudoxanthomonas sp. 10H TaxID=3242729 RepID=UPI003556D83B